MTVHPRITTNLKEPTGDSGLIRKAFAQFPSGVVVVAADFVGERHAIVASSFMVGVSLDPCLVAVAVQKTSETWERMSAASQVGISVFGKGQNDLVRQLGSKNRAARFNEAAVEVDGGGAVFIEDAALWLQCTIHTVSEAGDHWIVLFEVARLQIGTNEPLVWHGATFREMASI